MINVSDTAENRPPRETQAGMGDRPKCAAVSAICQGDHPCLRTEADRSESSGNECRAAGEVGDPLDAHCNIGGYSVIGSTNGGSFVARTNGPSFKGRAAGNVVAAAISRDLTAAIRMGAKIMVGMFFGDEMVVISVGHPDPGEASPATPAPGGH